jgi:hypothetical protein
LKESLIVYTKDLRSGSTLPSREGERKNDSPHPLTGGLAETRRNMKSYHKIPRRTFIKGETLRS